MILFSVGRLRSLAIVAVAFALYRASVNSTVLAADPPSKTHAAPGLLDSLEKSWPDYPEWLAMYVDILDGSQLGPSDGWFRKASAKSRLDWVATRSKLDKDGDGKVSRSEFKGTDADFARLDRDRDGSIGEPDFDFSTSALAPSTGMSVFYRADRDGNGKITRDELNALFNSADRDKLGFLSLGDLQDAFSPAPRSRGSSGGSQGPTRDVLIKGLFRQEIGSLQPGPKVGELAPDFTLKTVDGKSEVKLSKAVGPKPVVLVFGNFTCGPFRGQAGNVEKLYQRYKDRATFLMVYVREAHPKDGWSMESNDRVGVALRQPQTFEERVGVATTCSNLLGLGFPMLVDAIDDPVGSVYSGMPSRLYLIDRDGKIAFKNGRGPFGFKPAELEHNLLLLLNEAPREQVSRADSKVSIPAGQR